MVFFDAIELFPFAFTALAVACTLITGATALLLAGPAARRGFVSRHRRDRFGAGRIPLTGGPALLLGMVVPLALLGWPLPWSHLAILAGFFLAGLLDDAKDLRAAPKFALQACVALPAGLLFAPSAAYVGLVAFLFLLLVNASNYIDNMDGLLPGIALVQGVTLLLLSTLPTTGAPLLVWGLPAIVFLTLPPARLYLGDSGSHLVGALLALDAVGHAFGPDGVRTRYFLPLAVLFAVPLLDVGTVTVSRLVRRRPIFRGGLDHLSHLLVRLGFPVPRAVLVLVLASGMCGVASLLLAHSS